MLLVTEHVQIPAVGECLSGEGPALVELVVGTIRTQRQRELWVARKVGRHEKWLQEQDIGQVRGEYPERRRVITNRRLVDLVEDRVARHRPSISVMDALADEGVKPAYVEGYDRSEWILLDYFDFIVHVFAPETRVFYSLERLWGNAERIEVAAGG